MGSRQIASLRNYLWGGICAADLLGVLVAGVALFIAFEVVLQAYCKYIGWVKKFAGGFGAIGVMKAYWLGGYNRSKVILQELGGRRRITFVKHVKKGTATRFTMVADRKWLSCKDMDRIVSVLTREGVGYRLEGDQKSKSSRLTVDCEDDLGRAIVCARAVMNEVLGVGSEDLVRIKDVGFCNSRRAYGWDDATLIKNNATRYGFFD
jgi:hypothetical protein